MGDPHSEDKQQNITVAITQLPQPESWTKEWMNRNTYLWENLEHLALETFPVCKPLGPECVRRHIKTQGGGLSVNGFCVMDALRVENEDEIFEEKQVCALRTKTKTKVSSICFEVEKLWVDSSSTNKKPNFETSFKYKEAGKIPNQIVLTKQIVIPFENERIAFANANDATETAATVRFTVRGLLERNDIVRASNIPKLNLTKIM